MFLHLCPPPVRPVVELQRTLAYGPGNKLIAITKVKIITLYKACKVRLQYRNRACGVAILQKSWLWAAYAKSSILIWNMNRARSYILKCAKNLISTTVYSIACKFDGATDMEKLQIQKSQIYRNNTLIFRFELHFVTLGVATNAPSLFSIKSLFPTYSPNTWLLI